MFCKQNTDVTVTIEMVQIKKESEIQSFSCAQRKVILFYSMRREGVKYNIRTNRTLKYCTSCMRNDHVDRDHPIRRHQLGYIFSSALVDVVPIGRFTKKPLFACRHSHGCKQCSHTFVPYDKAVKKAKGNRKQESKSGTIKYALDICGF